MSGSIALALAEQSAPLLIPLLTGVAAIALGLFGGRRLPGREPWAAKPRWWIGIAVVAALAGVIWLEIDDGYGGAALLVLAVGASVNALLARHSSGEAPGHRANDERAE